MPDFAPNYTPRIKVAYSTLGHTHDMLFRVPRGTTAAELAPWYAKITAWLNALVSLRYADFAFINTQYAQEDSELFFPVASPPDPVVGGVAVPSPISYANVASQVSFPGRSLGGLRGINYLISASLTPFAGTPGLDARVTAIELALVATAVNALNAAPSFVGNDNASLIYYAYVNLKQSSYWTRRARQ